MSTSVSVSVATRGHNVLALIQDRCPDYHPIVAMAEMATSNDREITHELRFQCHKELAKYVAPSLKATDVHQSSSDLPTVKVVMFDRANVQDAEIISE